MAIDSPTMGQIISNVFDEMLEMGTEPMDATSEVFEQERVVACIRISGSTEQLVVVEAPMQTARLVGENMFAAEPGTLAEDEVRDAVGEVVNMIGGNVKGTYEGDSKLSLPCVSEESGPAPTDIAVGERTAVNVSGQPILIRWQDLAPATV